MISRPLPFLVFTCACLFGFLAAGTRAQDEKPRPELKAKFHQDFRGGDPKNPHLRLIRDGNFRWEAEGARVTLPAGEGKIPTTGVAATFRIRGDFVMTAAYEILKAEKPQKGPGVYGVGVSLFVAIDPGAMHAVSLARRHMVTGNQLFLSDRMKPANPEPEHLIGVRQAKAAAGKLRIERVGSMVRFLVAEADNADFLPIYQDGKTKKIDGEFSNAEIRYFQFGADAGNSEAALDVRLLDLTVHAEELPGYADAAPVTSPWPKIVANRNGSTTSWLTIGVAAGGGLALLAVIGGAGWFLLRRRQAAGKGTKTEPAKAMKPVLDEHASTVGVECSECGKKMNVKGVLAGKKVKCAGCGTSLRVPDM